VNFALPDLRSRTPIHVGSGHTLGERGGEQAHTLSHAELPAHTHDVRASSSATGGTANPNGAYLGGANNAYHAPGGAQTTMSPGTVTTVGGSQAHLNMQPFLTLNFCIALQGIFPSPS
jgi:microcystin-dependent protein